MTQGYRLTANQWGMLFLDRILPESPLYHVIWTCPVDGPLDVDVLREAIRAVAVRQAALRTRFDLTGLAEGGAAAQWVDDDPRVDFAVVPADEVLQSGDWERIDVDPVHRGRLAAFVAEPPFDLSAGPLFRVRVIRHAADRHRLLFDFHHLVFDGWSVGVFLTDLADSYVSLAGGGDGRLPPSTLDYGGFAERQAAQLPDITARQLPYWRTQLAGVPAVSHLPLDRPRPPAQRFLGAEVERAFPVELRGRLDGYARRARVTLFMVLVAAFKAQLAGYAGGAGDIVIGCPMGARTQPGARDLIGYLINMTVLRTQVPPGATVGDVVRQVRGTVLDAMANQDVPFDTVVSEVRPSRSLAYNPLFQVLFAADENVPDEVSLGAARLGAVRDVPTFAAKFDLTVTVRHSPGEFVVNIEYATDLFDEATVAAIVDDYQRSLEALLADPDIRVADLPLAVRGTAPTEPAVDTTAGPYVAPSTDVERELVAIWADVLGLPDIGVTDDFFRLAGDSLRASQVIARVSERFGVEVSVRAMFECLTVAALAVHVTGLVGDASAERRTPQATPRARVKLGDLLSANSRVGAEP